MRMLYFIINATALCFLASCSNSYSVDFRKIHFPGRSQLDKAAQDSILKMEQAHAHRRSDDSLFAATDRKIYHSGEEVTLKIVNNGTRTVYFYESDEETQRRLNTLPDSFLPRIKDLRKALISDNPAIIGAVVYSDPCFVSIYLGGVNKMLAEKLGAEAFEDPLKPGETMVFKVTMPERPGRYCFRLTRQNHEPFGLWGLNRELVSNTFEVVEK